MHYLVSHSFFSLDLIPQSMQLFQTVWNMGSGKPDLEMTVFSMHLAGLLGKYGYIANQTQNATVLSIMKHAFTTIPGALWIVTAVVLFFYRLNKKRYNEIVEELKNGRKS